MNSMNYLKIVLLLCFVIAVEVESNEILRKIVFKRSKLLVIVQKQINDTRYLAKLYNGIYFNCK